MAAAAFSLLLASASVSAQEAPAPQAPATITVSGLGFTEVKPDLARLIVSVSTEAETIPQSTALNKEFSDRLLARLQALAIPAADIRTLNLDVFRPYDSSKLSFSSRGFQTNHTLQITLHEPAMVGKIAGDLMTVDNTMVRRITWDINNRQDTDDKARAAAVANARHRAEIYAQAAGMKLGRLVLIRDEPSRGSDTLSFVAQASSGDNTLSIVPPATLTFSANTQMIWELAP